MMKKKSGSLQRTKLSKARTFLSLERNALSEERTILSYIRTELAFIGVIAILLRFFFAESYTAVVVSMILIGAFILLLLIESVKIHRLRLKRRKLQREHKHLKL